MKLLVVCRRSVQRGSVSFMPKSSYVKDMVSVQALQGVGVAYHLPRGVMSWNAVPAAIRGGKPICCLWPTRQCGLGEPGLGTPDSLWHLLPCQAPCSTGCYYLQLCASSHICRKHEDTAVPLGWGLPLLFLAQGNPHLFEPLNIAVNTDSK